MSVCGFYKDAFAEATHCLFNGNLDNPAFCDVAIQRVIGRTADTVTLSKSGELQIMKQGDREYVDLTYQGYFGKERTTGHPFKDNKTELPKPTLEPQSKGKNELETD